MSVSEAEPGPHGSTPPEEGGYVAILAAEDLTPAGSADVLLKEGRLYFAIELHVGVVSAATLIVGDDVQLLLRLPLLRLPLFGFRGETPQRRVIGEVPAPGYVSLPAGSLDAGVWIEVVTDGTVLWGRLEGCGAK